MATEDGDAERALLGLLDLEVRAASCRRLAQELLNPDDRRDLRELANEYALRAEALRLSGRQSETDPPLAR